MFKKSLLVVALGVAFSLPAFAEDAPAAAAKPFTVTSNVGMVSDYIYRGITQTSHSAAVQGGFDLAHSSGAYAGVWGSNVSWITDSGATVAGKGGPTMELDTYFGYKGAPMEDVGYDVGYVRYNYLGTYTPATGFNNADTAEVYAAVSYKFVTLKYSYSLLDGFLTVADTKGTNYLDLTASYTLADSGVTLLAHAGKQTITGKNNADTSGNALSYSDYKLGVSKDFGGYVLGLAYTTTNVTPAWEYNTLPKEGMFWGKSVTAVSLTHAM
jgi:uncharacterized protein (TIGR02001 family)